jgi:hypothetical protein
VYDELAELYALGERLLDSTVRNAIIKEMVKFTKLGGEDEEIHWFPNNTATNTIYECTTAAFPARRFLVDLFVINAEPDWIQGALHSELLRDLAKAFLSELDASGLKCRSRVMQAKDYYV